MRDAHSDLHCDKPPSGDEWENGWVEYPTFIPANTGGNLAMTKPWLNAKSPLHNFQRNFIIIRLLRGVPCWINTAPPRDSNGASPRQLGEFIRRSVSQLIAGVTRGLGMVVSQTKARGQKAPALMTIKRNDNIIPGRDDIDANLHTDR
jgi:hypothetical protein